MNRKHYQHKFHQWLSAYGVLTFETAKRTARAYLPPDFPFAPTEKEKAENVLFWPLVRSGVVRYLGSNRYALSPPHAFCLTDGRYLSVNCPITPDQANYEDSASHPGLHISSSPPSVSNVQLLDDFSLTDYLPLIPPLRKIITSWPVASSQTYRQVRHRGSWTPINGNNTTKSVQILRTTTDFGGKRVVRINKVDHSIPSDRSNPGAYSLAVLYADLQSVSAFAPLSIDSVAHTVTISSKIFPVELRKLLFLEHLISQSAFPEDNNVLTFRPSALPFLLKRLSPHYD
jgi:hypothetical protein